MPETSGVELGLKITAAVDYARAGDDDEMRPHYLRTVQQITDEVRLSDLTTTELVALKALLIPAHSRAITGRGRPETTPPVGKLLRIVSRDNAAG